MCDTCGLTFARPSALYEHQQGHELEQFVQHVRAFERYNLIAARQQQQQLNATTSGVNVKRTADKLAVRLYYYCLLFIIIMYTWFWNS